MTLKPCPCCGAPAVQLDHSPGRDYPVNPVMCAECGLEAIDSHAWNFRAIEGDLLAVCEAMVAWWRKWEVYPPSMAQARPILKAMEAAIARAKGGT